MLSGLANAPLEALSIPEDEVAHDDAPHHNEELITNILYLGSYDFVNKSTIIVPGTCYRLQVPYDVLTHHGR